MPWPVLFERAPSIRCSVDRVVLPSGTVTFLFTDIEGSTRAWEVKPVEMREALARHDELLRNAIDAAGGSVFKTVGDAFCAVFPQSRSVGLDAAL
jgi:class 3 adenylate cyclase